MRQADTMCDRFVFYVYLYDLPAPQSPWTCQRPQDEILLSAHLSILRSVNVLHTPARIYFCIIASRFKRFDKQHVLDQLGYGDEEFHN